MDLSKMEAARAKASKMTALEADLREIILGLDKNDVKTIDSKEAYQAKRRGFDDPAYLNSVRELELMIELDNQLETDNIAVVSGVSGAGANHDLVKVARMMEAGSAPPSAHGLLMGTARECWTPDTTTTAAAAAQAMTPNDVPELPDTPWYSRALMTAGAKEFLNTHLAAAARKNSICEPILGSKNVSSMSTPPFVDQEEVGMMKLPPVTVTSISHGGRNERRIQKRSCGLFLAGFVSGALLMILITVVAAYILGNEEPGILCFEEPNEPIIPQALIQNNNRDEGSNDDGRLANSNSVQEQWPTHRETTTEVNDVPRHVPREVYTTTGSPPATTTRHASKILTTTMGMSRTNPTTIITTKGSQAQTSTQSISTSAPQMGPTLPSPSAVQSEGTTTVPTLSTGIGSGAPKFNRTNVDASAGTGTKKDPLKTVDHETETEDPPGTSKDREAGFSKPPPETTPQKGTTPPGTNNIRDHSTPEPLNEKAAPATAKIPTSLEADDDTAPATGIKPPRKADAGTNDVPVVPGRKGRSPDESRVPQESNIPTSANNAATNTTTEKPAQKMNAETTPASSTVPELPPEPPRQRERREGWFARLVRVIKDHIKKIF